MAESETSLAQRVESLERTSHERVVEQVADLGERVTGLESARDAENPHLATKADIARLETQIGHTQEQIGQLDKKIDARYDQLDKKIDANHDQLDKKIDARYDQLDKKIDANHDQLDKKIDAVYDHLDKKIDANHDQLNKKIDEQSDVYQSKLDAQTEMMQKILEQRINRLIGWLLGTVIAVAALILSQLSG